MPTAALTLAEATTPSSPDAVAIPTGWRQGRGAYGGLVIATALRAIEARLAAPERTIRAVTAELPGPAVPGAAALEVDLLRAGSSVTTARAVLRQDGEVRTHVVAILSVPRQIRDAPAWQTLEAPAAPPWRSVAAVPAGGPWPEFAQHFEYRAVDGVPGSGGDPRCLGWIRPRHAGPPRDAAFVAAVIDAWWPAALIPLATPRPIATIAYTLELVGELVGLDPDAPLLYRATVPVCGDGWFLETRELWGEDGRLIARNHQTFAIIA